MKVLLTIALLALAAAPVVAQNVVVDFDDFQGMTLLPAGYGGVAEWNNWAATTGDASYPPLSAPNVAINVGAPSAIEFGQEVTLIGFSFTGPNPAPIPVRLSLLLAGAVVFEIEEFYPNEVASFSEVPFDGLIDTMRFDPVAGQPFGFFCIDDLTYATGTVATEGRTLSSIKSLFE